MKNEGPVYRRSPQRAVADTDDTYSDEPSEKRHTARGELQARLAELEAQNRELREAQARAESNHHIYVELYEDSPVAHLVLDKDGIILRASRAAGDLLDTPVRRLIRKPFHLFVQRDTLNEYRAHCREAILTRQKVACGALLRIRDRNPVEARLEIVGMRYPEAEGLACHMAIVEIRELEESDAPAEGETAHLPHDLPAVNLATSGETKPLWGQADPQEDPHSSHEAHGALGCIRNILTLLSNAVPGDHPYTRYIPMAEERLNDIAAALERLPRKPADETPVQPLPARNA
ncbi:MAG: PAS domain-containing protein [FCB group bacterium]|jgi:PAS domain-containing protein|nr:PAS domain-containing protein [FCB group bacterium]